MVRVAGALLLAMALAMTAAADAPKLPPALQRLLPAGYVPISAAESQPDPEHIFVFVALAKKGELAGQRVDNPSARPLIVYRKTRFGYRQVARNDRIVLRSNEGGQCDPFEYGDIKTKGGYVSIEHNVACGQHWESTTTFRFDRSSGAYVFDNERYKSWKFNPDHRPDAEALIPDINHIERAKGRVIALDRWRPRD